MKPKLSDLLRSIADSQTDLGAIEEARYVIHDAADVLDNVVRLNQTADEIDALTNRSKRLILPPEIAPAPEPAAGKAVTASERVAAWPAWKRAASCDPKVRAQAEAELDNDSYLGACESAPLPEDEAGIEEEALEFARACWPDRAVTFTDDERVQMLRVARAARAMREKDCPKCEVERVKTDRLDAKLATAERDEARAETKRLRSTGHRGQGWAWECPHCGEYRSGFDDRDASLAAGVAHESVCENGPVRALRAKLDAAERESGETAKDVKRLRAFYNDVNREIPAGLWPAASTLDAFRKLVNGYENVCADLHALRTAPPASQS